MSSSRIHHRSSRPLAASCKHPGGVLLPCVWLARKDRPWRFRFDDCPLANDTRPSAFSKTRRRPPTNRRRRNFFSSLVPPPRKSKHTSTSVEHVQKRREGLDTSCKSGHVHTKGSIRTLVLRPKALWRPLRYLHALESPPPTAPVFLPCPFQSASSRQPPSIRILAVQQVIDVQIPDQGVSIRTGER